MAQHRPWSPLAWACLIGVTLGLTLGDPPRAGTQSGLSQVNHIVIVMQENHSFDNSPARFSIGSMTPRCPG